MAEKTEKKLTGLQMPLNISPELAKIIGTKKGEQVNNFFECRQENFNFTLAGVAASGDQEVVGIPQGKELAGPYQQAVLHSWQNYGGNLWHKEAEVFRDVQAPQGAFDQP